MYPASSLEHTPSARGGVLSKLFRGHWRISRHFFNRGNERVYLLQLLAQPDDALQLLGAADASLEHGIYLGLKAGPESLGPFYRPGLHADPICTHANLSLRMPDEVCKARLLPMIPFPRA
jgi:hypothetical protein